MKILLTAHGYPPELAGGTERYVEALATRLVGRGHEVMVVAGTLQCADSVSAAEVEQRGVRVMRLRRDDVYFESWEKSWHPGVSRWFHDLLRRERPDLVHVNHWFRLSRDLVHLARRAGVPAIVTLHDYFASCPTFFRLLPGDVRCDRPPGPNACAGCLTAAPWWGTGEAAATMSLFANDMANELQLAARVLALSRTQAEHLRRAWPEAAVRVEEHPFCAVEELRPAPAPPPPPPLRVLNFGHVRRQKGQHLLLEAVRMMRSPQSVRVDIYGACHDAAYTLELDRLAAGLDVRRHGAFAFEDLRQGFHVAVFPSLCHETYGMVVDEARMLGLPVLASDGSAGAERLGAGGEVFQHGDAGALAERLDRYVQEPEHLLQLRRAVQPPPPWREHVDFIESVYCHAVAQRGPAVEDRFDLEAHAAFEYQRFIARERQALRNQQNELR